MTASDSIYYRDGATLPLSRRLMRQARQAIYALFVAEMKPDASTSILDIGVSDEENDEANMLEKLHPYVDRITCAGLGDGDHVRKAYPTARYVKIDIGKPLPFADKTFDIVCSNAVLEHVGGADDRRAFLQEAMRVARAAFITVPNRWFPVEHHTGIPFAHYSPALFRTLVRSSRLSYWSDPRNLDFLDRRTLRREWPGPGTPKVVHTGLPLGPFSSNLALILRSD